MDDNTMLNFFTDVHAEDYYYDAVLWAAQKGITGGMSDTLFAPNAACTRAQIVTFLWRAAGSPEPKALSSFADVPADAYYAKAVAWAVENGITEGTSDTTFAPGTICTRAQGAAFLYSRSQGRYRRSAAAAAFADVACRMHTTLSAVNVGGCRRALPAASAAACSARTAAVRVHRSSRSCTECTAANKQINRWKAAAGEYPLPPSVYRSFAPSHALERAAFSEKPLQ